jgi:hypothetical protein
LEQLVADSVAEAIVDQLESIQVQEEYRKADPFFTEGSALKSAEEIHEHGPVREPRQRVVKRIVTKLFFCFFPLGDVGLRTSHPGCLTTVVSKCQSPAEHPTVVAVSVSYPVLAFEMLGLSAEMLLKLSLDSLPVIGVDESIPVVYLRTYILLRPTEHLFPT